MNFKKDLPKLIVAFVFLVALMMYVEIRGSEVIPSLLGFALGGLMIFLFIKKVLKK